MNRVREFAMAACLAMPLSTIVVASANADPVVAATTAAPTKAALEAMLSKCSNEADAKGLFVKAGKGAARKTFRRDCMRKMGVNPR